MLNTAPDGSPSKAWIITGPTSGIGRRTALELVRHGIVVLVGRDPIKLRDLEADINALPHAHTLSVVCDLSDFASTTARGGGDREARSSDRWTPQ